ncbi:MAG: hypothetical protein IKZ91_04395 [Bacteroidales bacterium]|nr:hypothetical protein [Bacteroidales bacterium]
MKKALLFILLAVTAFAATSCSTTLKTMKEPIVQFQLNSNDYVLSEQVTGEAVVTRILGVDWSRLFVNKLGSTTSPIYGITTTVSLDDTYAVYDLLEKNPGYDFVMYPQFTTVAEGVEGIYVKKTIKVTARLGKMKK